MRDLKKHAISEYQELYNQELMELHTQGAKTKKKKKRVKNKKNNGNQEMEEPISNTESNIQSQNPEGNNE